MPYINIINISLSNFIEIIDIKNIDTFLAIFSGIAFVAYGVSLFFSDKMKSEFERFQLQKFMYLVGLLEILGGLGQLIGIFVIPLLVFSSIGLSILMLMGVLTRVRLKDNFTLILPAFFFLILNSYLFFKFI